MNDSNFDLKIQEMFLINWSKLRLINVAATDVKYFVRKNVLSVQLTRNN